MVFYSFTKLVYHNLNSVYQLGGIIMGERINAAKEFLFENVLQISANYGAEMIKEVARQAALDLSLIHI